jgi:hypothetical protein
VPSRHTMSRFVILSAFHNKVPLAPLELDSR